MSLSVSVVIPLYNHARFIAATLDSVLAQTLPAKEIVVVDDGSTDASAAIASGYAARHSAVRVIRQANAGAHCAINTGVAVTSGDVVAILNSDDAFASDRLAVCCDMLAAEPGTDAVVTALTFMDDNGCAIDNPWYRQALEFFRHEQDAALALLNGNFAMTTSNLVMRRSLPAEIGGFRGLRYAHDLDFLLRIFLAGKCLHWIDRPLMTYRLHAGNTIKEDARKVRLEWAACVAWFVHELFRRGDTGEAAWIYRERILKVIERHRLSGLVFLFMGYFEALPIGRRSVETFLADPAFHRRMLALT